MLFLLIGRYIFLNFLGYMNISSGLKITVLLLPLAVEDRWGGGGGKEKGEGLRYEDLSKGRFILNGCASSLWIFMALNMVWSPIVSTRRLPFFRNSSISNYFVINVSLSIAPLGSIPELPAESCEEIKASEGQQVVSGQYWIYSAIHGKAVLAYCDMETEGGVIDWKIKLVQ